MNYKFIIDSDIAKAETLPGWFYNSEEVFKLLKEKIFLNALRHFQILGKWRYRVSKVEAIGFSEN